MKTIFILHRNLLGLLILLIASPLFAQISNPDAEREIIVMFKPGIINLPVGRDESLLSEITVQVPAIQNVLARHSVETVIKAFPNFQLADTLGVARTGEVVKLANLSNIFKLRLPRGGNLSQTIQELVSLPEVVYAERNGYAAPAVVYPNDAWFDDPNNPGTGGLQWNLLNTGQSGGASDADIDAPEAWDITKGSSSTKIGIIDGGVENWHEDLSGKVSGDAGWSQQPPWYGHGFHVAGIAAAKTNNVSGVAGVDWNAQLISQRIDNQTDDTGIFNAITDAVNAGAVILNNSWGLTPPNRYSNTVRLAFSNAYKRNVTATVAMGNSNSSTPQYPAGFGQGIIAVGATTRNDLRWVSTSTSGSNTGNHIDIVAPGEQILTRQC